MPAREIRSPFQITNPQAGDGRLDGDFSIAPEPANREVGTDPKALFAPGRASTLNYQPIDVPLPAGTVLPSFVIPGDPKPVVVQPVVVQSVPKQMELWGQPITPPDPTMPMTKNDNSTPNRIPATPPGPPPAVPPVPITRDAARANTKLKGAKSGTPRS